MIMYIIRSCHKLSQRRDTFLFFVISDAAYSSLQWTHIPYAGHYEPQLVYFFTHFSLRLILQSG